MTNLRWMDATGKCCIVRKFWSNLYDEVKILKISPKGDKIKFEWESSHGSWEKIEDYVLEEIL